MNLNKICAKNLLPVTQNCRHHAEIRFSIVFLIAVLISICLTSCTLDRKNPLDPKNNPKIKIPNEVVGLSLQSSPRNSPTKWVRISWQEDSSVDGYYIYRGRSLTSQFVRIQTIDQNYVKEYTDSDNINTGIYWYRISAYKEYPEGALEGKLSPLTENSVVEVRE